MFSSFFRTRPGRHPVRPGYRPTLERLEDRTTPTTFFVTNFNDAGAGTLRAAIASANSHVGADTIAFAAPLIFPPPVRTINLASPLVVTDALTIDGTITVNVAGQPTKKPGIELNGAGMTFNSSSIGLRILADGCTIKGLIVNRCGGAGIQLDSDNNTVQGCFIGTNKDGGATPSSQARGVLIFGSGNLIGGLTAVARNVISNNSIGVRIEGDFATLNTVQGNSIGTNAAGNAPVANGAGIHIFGAADNDIVGNIIGGNSGSGIVLAAQETTGNHIRANTIGTIVNGVVLRNSDGIQINAHAHDNLIGGDNAGDGNVIAFNTSSGVALDRDDPLLFHFAAGPGNSILNNIIVSSTNLIDLGEDGPTPNDPLDADTGPNNFQNTAVLTAAGPQGNQTRITGTFNSTPNSSFRFQFFQTTSFAGGVPKNMTLLGDEFEQSNNAGNVTISFSFPTIASGTGILMTATDTATGDTSEFSNIVTVANNSPMIRDDALTPDINEGEKATLSGRLVDPDPGDNLSLIVNWGDGTPVQTYHPGLDPFAFNHRYVDDGTFNVQFTWIDNHGAFNTRTRQVVVHNVVPDLESLRVLPSTTPNRHLLLQGDVHDPGVNDKIKVTIDWGDDTVETFDLAKKRSFNAGHRYKVSGLYTIKLTLTDDDGGINVLTRTITVA